MGKRLFVGGLPYRIEDKDLNEMFAKFGTVVSATVVMDRFSGRSKGFGFVEMSTEEEAAAAKTGLNGSEIDGRKIMVDEAKPMEQRPQDGGFRSGGGDRRFGSNDRRPSYSNRGDR